MHSADIQSALKKVNFSGADIARQCGVSRVTVSKIVLGRDRSERIEKAISEATKLPLHVLWPQYYIAPDDGVREPHGTKYGAPDPLAALLISEFAKLDLSKKALVLRYIAELSGGNAPNSSGATVSIYGKHATVSSNDMRDSNAPITVNMGSKRK